MSIRNTKSNSSGVIFELITQGAYVKVSAIDAATGTEVSIVGDPAVGQKSLQLEAAKKLKRILAQKKPKTATKPSTTRRPNPPSGWDL